MEKWELKRQRIQPVNPVGINPLPASVPPLRVLGIHGGSDFVIGVRVNGNVVDRLPGETVDQLTFRVQADAEVRGDPANEAHLIYEA